MKKILATFLVTGSAITLSACENMTFDDPQFAVPYTLERTATHHQKTSAPEPVAVKEEVVVVEEERQAAPEPVETPTEKVFTKSQSK